MTQAAPEATFLTTVTPSALVPGSRWVARTGKHEDTEIEIEKVSDVSVFFKTVVGGANYGNQKLDDSKVNRLTIESFRGQYVEKRSLVPGETRGGRAFRQHNPKRERPNDISTLPLQLNGHALSGSAPLHVEITEITPLIAKAWLDRGGINRHLSERRVRRLVAAIRRGEWQLTGDSIKLDEHGVVRDGQHRLRAIVEAGMPITSLVVRNVPAPAFNVIDTGKPRTPGDVLSMYGIKSVYATAACARGVLLIEKYGRYSVSSREAEESVSNAAILEYVQAHPDIIEGVHLGDMLKTAGFLGGTGLLAVLCTLLLRTDREAALLFVNQLVEGANLESTSPILRFRNRMLNQSLYKKAAPEREETLAIGIKVWNAWRNGERMQALVWRGYRERGAEPFPKPV